MIIDNQFTRTFYSHLIFFVIKGYSSDLSLTLLKNEDWELSHTLKKEKKKDIETVEGNIVFLFLIIKL